MPEAFCVVVRVNMADAVPLPKPCTAFRDTSLTVAGAGFETMAGAQNSVRENASRIASRDQVSLDQVQQTAARGKAHVQGKLVCPYVHCLATRSMMAIWAQESVMMRKAKHHTCLLMTHDCQSSGSCACGHWVLLTVEGLFFILPVMVASTSIQVIIEVS